MVVLHDDNVEIVESEEEETKQKSSSSDINLYTDSEDSGTSLRATVTLPPMISVLESIATGTPIMRLLADDKDANTSITYKIAKETSISKFKKEQRTSKKHFSVHPTIGEVTIASKLSPETEYQLTIAAFDNEGYGDNITLRIYAKDVNDHAPVFSESSYDFDILEGVYSDHFIGKITTTDADYGDNAKVTYTITKNPMDDSVLPFRISPTSGEIFAWGSLDRESKSLYSFKVVASDNAKEGEQLSSTADVKIHITDVNDHPPKFLSFDRLIEIPRSELESFENDFKKEEEEKILVPVYYTSVRENSALGIPIIKIFANDSDFPGNGNGLFLFDIIRKKNEPTFFEIDYKEGIVTVSNQLDYEQSPSHNITVVASDLGKPSLSSTALIMVNVIDVPEKQGEVLVSMFDHRYYEVEIEENSEVPLQLLTVNVTDKYRGQNIKFSIVPWKDGGVFSVDPRNGTLYLLVKPDREEKAKYEVKVKVDKLKRGRGMTLIYPPPKEKIADLG